MITYDDIIRYYQFHRYPHYDLCYWFQVFAYKTWHRINFVRSRPGLKCWETTITQNIMFDLWEFQEFNSRRNRDSIILLEAENERTNGNDIEIYIQTQSGLLYFPTQAKIIYHNGKDDRYLEKGNYPRLNHTTRDSQQIDMLCEHARSTGGIPLYLFYNYLQAFSETGELCGIEFDEKQYGCSIVNAEILRPIYTHQVVEDGINKTAWRSIPTFRNLHPHLALPWFVLVCCFTGNNIGSIYEKLKITEPNYEVKQYNIEDLKDNNKWIKFNPYMKKSYKSFKEEEEITKDFNPRFKMIINSRG